MTPDEPAKTEAPRDFASVIERVLDLLRQKKIEEDKIAALIAAGEKVGATLATYARQVEEAALEARRYAANAIRMIVAEIMADSPEQKIADMYARLRRIAAETGLAELIPWAALNGVIASKFGDEGLERVQANAYQRVRKQAAEMRPANVVERQVRKTVRRGPIAARANGKPRYAQGGRRG